MRYFETFDTEEQLRQRIESLRGKDYSFNEFEVFTSNELSGDADLFDVNHHDAEPGLGDKIAAFFTGEDPEERVFDKYGWDDATRLEAKRAVDSGKYLLVVDREGYYEDESNFDYGVGANGYRDENNLTNDRDNGLLNENRDRDLLNDRDRNLNEDRDFVTDKDTKFGEDSEENIRLHEERLRVDKEREQAGEVVIDKDVVTEQKEVDVPITREKVTVERRPVTDDTDLDKDFNFDKEKDEIRVPIHEERVNVEKDTVVNEELVVKKEVEKDVETVREDVRRETAEVRDEGNLIKDDENLLDRDRNLDERKDGLFEDEKVDRLGQKEDKLFGQENEIGNRDNKLFDEDDVLDRKRRDDDTLL